MDTVKQIINEVTESDNFNGNRWSTIISDQVEAGVIVVAGDYDQDEDLVNVYFISSDESAEFSGDWSDLSHEVSKTIMHEEVHRKQWVDGYDTSMKIGQSHAEYMLNDVEVEARAKVDIPMDLEYWGVSEDLQEYIEYFKGGYNGSYDAILYIEKFIPSKYLENFKQGVRS